MACSNFGTLAWKKKWKNEKYKKRVEFRVPGPKSRKKNGTTHSGLFPGGTYRGVSVSVRARYCNWWLWYNRCRHYGSCSNKWYDSSSDLLHIINLNVKTIFYSLPKRHLHQWPVPRWCEGYCNRWMWYNNCRDNASCSHKCMIAAIVAGADERSTVSVRAPPLELPCDLT